MFCRDREKKDIDVRVQKRVHMATERYCDPSLALTTLFILSPGYKWPL